jgi:peptide-methionine (S)-S-oxide reductase
MFSFKKMVQMPAAGTALPGRATAIPTAEKHAVTGRSLKGPYPDGMAKAMFGLGCFWGAERVFWKTPGVWVTAVGYAAGVTPNPTYEEVCSGRTGHNEVVFVVYDPKQITYTELLKVFWEGHNPTQGMRQGNDTGTQYRSGIYVYDAAQRAAAEASKSTYETALPCKARALRPSPRKSWTRLSCFSPRTITSNISPKIPTAIADWAAPESSARSGPALTPKQQLASPPPAMPSIQDMAG